MIDEMARHPTCLVHADFSPKNPKFEAVIAVWQRLPLAVTKVLGPRLIGMFP